MKTATAFALSLLISFLLPSLTFSTLEETNHDRHFIIVTQARSLSTLLDELLRRPDLRLHSYGELFNPKGVTNHSAEEFEYAWIAGPNGEAMAKSLAFEWNERHNYPVGVLLTPENILTETMGFFQSHPGKTGFKLLYEQIGRPTPLEVVAKEMNVSIPAKLAQAIVGRRRRPRDKELVLPHFHFRLAQQFRDLKIIFLIRDFFDAGLSNFEARALNAWSFLSTQKHRTKKLLKKKIQINTPEDVSSFLKMLSFTCSINLQLQKEAQWFVRHRPASAMLIAAEQLRDPFMRVRIMKDVFTLLLGREPKEGVVEKNRSFTNEQGRSSIPMSRRIENWKHVKEMIPQSEEWAKAKIQPECRELIQRRLFITDADDDLESGEGEVEVKSKKNHSGHRRHKKKKRKWKWRRCKHSFFYCLLRWIFAFFFSF